MSLDKEIGKRLLCDCCKKPIGYGSRAMFSHYVCSKKCKLTVELNALKQRRQELIDERLQHTSQEAMVKASKEFALCLGCNEPLPVLKSDFGASGCYHDVYCRTRYWTNRNDSLIRSQTPRIQELEQALKELDDASV